MAFPFAAAGLALGAAGLGFSIFGGRRAQRVNIGGELARIRGLFDQQREATRRALEQQAAELRTQAASGLATRGTLRAPIAEATFGQIRGRQQQAFGAALGQLAGQQAQAESALLRGLIPLQAQQQQQAAQRRAGRCRGRSG